MRYIVALLWLSLLTAAQTSTAVKTKGCNNYDSQHVCSQGQITTDAEEAKTILARGQYTVDGSGPAIYVFMSQNCPYSKAFFKDRARFKGVQFRYYPFIATIDDQNQSVQVLMSRSLPEFSSYMNKTLRVPAQSDPARDQALKDMVTARNRLDQIMAENGLYKITTPSWFFIGSEGSLWWTRGYGGPDPVDRIIAYLKPSSGTPQTTSAPTPPAPRGSVRVLYSFNGYDGSGPSQDLTFDAQGNLWGISSSGGEDNLGALFKLTPGGPNGTWSETVLSFKDDHEVGGVPKGGLIIDNAGNIYGTTQTGGPNQQGAVFEIKLGPNGTWSKTVLHTFSANDHNGNIPYGDLIMDKAGNIYGTNSLGGQGMSMGTVFELSRASSGTWSFATLHSFVADAGGGYGVSAGLVMDAAGNLYGTTIGGSNKPGASDADGVAFRLSRDSNGKWTETVLHRFHNPTRTDNWGRVLFPEGDGYGVKSPLIMDKAGNLYGTTWAGGTGDGIVFRLSPNSNPNGEWAETIINTFNQMKKKDGAGPLGRLAIDAAGNIYGTTTTGGTSTGGTIFKLAPGANGVWVETVIHSFPVFGPLGGKEGYRPEAGVIFDAAGNLYGSAQQAGPTNHFGTVFELPAASH